MISLNKRQIQLSYLLEKKDDYITIDTVSKIFGVSERTIRYDLDSVEKALKKYNITLDRKPRFGVKLNINDSTTIQDIMKEYEFKVYSSDERINIITLILLIEGKTTIEKIADRLGVSKNTIIQDFKSVKDNFKNSNIKIRNRSYHGLSLEGNEIEIRNTFFRLSNDLKENKSINMEEWILTEQDFSKNTALNIISKIEEKINVEYSEIAVEELELITLFIYGRWSNSNYVSYDDDEINNVKNERDFKVIKEVIEDVLKKQIKDEEVYYLRRLFKGSKTTTSEEDFDKTDEDKFNVITNEILEELYKVIDISCDEEFDLKKQMARHLKVATYRLKNQLYIDNPMVEEIKYKMSFIYNITEEILKDKEHILGVEFPDTEIAFMTLYFNALFERNISSSFKSRVLIVCNGGLATSSLLKARINIMIPEIEIISICRATHVERILKEGNVDFIISTIPLTIKNNLVIQVNPLLELEDTEKIKTAIFEKRYESNCKYLVDKVKLKKSKSLTALIKEEYSRFNEDIRDWKDAISLAAKPLLDHKKIKKQYINEMIRVVEELGTYMVFISEIAFVHAPPEYVIENSISLLTLKSPIDFGNKNTVKVKTIVVLANKEENMNLVNLIDILTKNKNVEEFKMAKSYKDIKNIQ